MPGPKYAIIHPDPFDFDPEDFTEDELDHGDGAWKQPESEEKPSEEE